MRFDALLFSADSTMSIGSRNSPREFRIDFLRSTAPVLVFEFDAEKGEMILTRGGQRIVFKKQQE
jgi:hypothetical protein